MQCLMLFSNEVTSIYFRIVFDDRMYTRISQLLVIFQLACNWWTCSVNHYLCFLMNSYYVHACMSHYDVSKPGGVGSVGKVTKIEGWEGESGVSVTVTCIRSMGTMLLFLCNHFTPPTASTLEKCR